MADPIKLLDAHARKLYNAWRAEKRRKRLGFVLDLSRSWAKLDNWDREEWRQKARLALCSTETLADELRREDRERSKLSERHNDSEGK